MEVKVSIHKTPQPRNREGKELLHARVESKGTRRLEDICKELVPLGLNTAQLKAILDGLAMYIGKSLREGYHIELEEIGTFSLSVKTYSIHDERDTSKTMIEIDGVNFKCSQKLKTRAQKARLSIARQKLTPPLTLTQRKKKMTDHLHTYGYINISQYARLNYCSYYEATKDIRTFEIEGLLKATGVGNRKIYIRMDA